MVSHFCCFLGMSRPNYYRHCRRRQQKELQQERILELVHQERRLQPKIGGRKLQELIGPQLAREGVHLGRDRFFDFLRERDLLIRRKRRKIQTTDSRHGEPVYPNRLKDYELTGAHQAWVSDLTYLQTVEGTLYLSLVTDAYSRKIVGWNLSPHLDTRGCIRALHQALRQLPEGAAPIHHSDRGCQYASRAYTQILQEHGCRISMTEQNHCYENAKAERVNGILKHEYELKQKWKTSSQLRHAVGQAIWLYNGRRPHMSLGYRTPDQVHSDADPSCADNPPLSRAAQVRTGPRTGSGCRQNQNPAPECKNGTF